MKDTHKTAIDEAAAAHQSATEAAQRKHAEAVAALEESARCSAEKHRKELDDAAEALRREQEQHGEARADCQQLRTNLREAQAALVDLGEKMEAADKAHREQVHKLEDDFAREKK